MHLGQVLVADRSLRAVGAADAEVDDDVAVTGKIVEPVAAAECASVRGPVGIVVDDNRERSVAVRMPGGRKEPHAVTHRDTQAPDGNLVHRTGTSGGTGVAHRVSFTDT